MGVILKKELSLEDMYGDNPLAPPRELLARLRLGDAPAARDHLGKAVAACSLHGLYALQGGLCCYCTQKMNLPNARYERESDAVLTALFSPLDVTMEHILPKAHQGPRRLFNAAAACRQCNSERGDLPLIIFLLAKKTGKLTHFQTIHRRNKNTSYACL